MGSTSDFSAFLYEGQQAGRRRISGICNGTQPLSGGSTAGDPPISRPRFQHQVGNTGLVGEQGTTAAVRLLASRYGFAMYSGPPVLPVGLGVQDALAKLAQPSQRRNETFLTCWSPSEMKLFSYFARSVCPLCSHLAINLHIGCAKIMVFGSAAYGSKLQLVAALTRVGARNAIPWY